MSTSLKVVSSAAVFWASFSRVAIVWRRRDILTRSSLRSLVFPGEGRGPGGGAFASGAGAFASGAWAPAFAGELEGASPASAGELAGTSLAGAGELFAASAAAR